MCGVAGIVGQQASAAAVRRAVEALHHRGPDASGVHVSRSGAAVVGAVRLRIIDVSDAGDQPMVSEDGSIAVAFNGELYNFRELRAGLQRRGHQFRTGTDTECLIHLHEEMAGDDEGFVSRLRGMFALAVWDERRQRLLLARDRVGIKPLVYIERQGSLAFASEARALVAAGIASGEPDLDAIRSSIAWGVIPAPATAFAGVRHLLPGHLLTWEAGRARTVRWWRPDLQPDPALVDRDHARREMAAALDDAVARQLVADRPVGCFLSSGTDSTAIATVAARHGLVRAFTVTFPEDPETDEGDDAARTAATLGLEHIRVPVTGSEAAKLLPEALAGYDHPTADAFNTWLVCRAVKDAGLVVALAGTGGDEVFGGYATFRIVPKLASLSPFLQKLPAKTAAALAARTGAGSAARRALAAERGISGAYAAVRSLFAPEEAMRLGGIPARVDTVHDLPPIDAVTLLELSRYLPDQLLADTDNVSMAHSLEVRVPLLDDAVVATALATPWAIRTSGSKDHLRTSAGMSAAIPKKTFTLPFDRWMSDQLKPAVAEGLLSDDLAFADLIPGSARKALWESFLSGHVHWARPWSIAVLRLWPSANNLSW